MKTLEDLRAELFKIGQQLCGGVRPSYYFFISDKPDGLATPYLEIHGEEYHFIISERGIERERHVTFSDEDILYWFTDCGVCDMASSYAALNNSPDRTFRDVYFRRQYHLMFSIKPEWATRKHKELTEILKLYPK
ncbi:hypothetical protein OI69_04530 [Pectobacterium fontis]|uniref:Immunity protein 63 domain-containing protein n=1 Tax=Pectobacterium fontis TaxID=2558042 RepID=A0A7V8L7B9_9GAMM|nr:hypothetical protein OI69_04530 [Pectobacterium fontis]